MPLSSLLTLLLNASLFVRLLRSLAYCVFGLGVLAWLVDHGGPPTGQVVVHVMEPDVQVTLGGNSYTIGLDPYVVIESELKRGWYELTMSRNGRILFQQEFKLRGGHSQVLTAYDSARVDPSNRVVGGTPN